MSNEIINRVANSKLVTIDLEDYYPEGKRLVLDIKEWLLEGLVLREKDFRQNASEHNWEQYNNCFVALNCSTDAIIPAWAYMLLSTYLEPYATKTVIGNLITLETCIYQNIISDLDITEFQDKPIIIKGCSNRYIPENAYVQLTTKLKPIAKSIMYGEACSSLPLYKKTGQP